MNAPDSSADDKPDVIPISPFLDKAEVRRTEASLDQRIITTFSQMLELKRGQMQSLQKERDLAATLAKNTPKAPIKKRQDDSRA